MTSWLDKKLLFLIDKFMPQNKEVEKKGTNTVLGVAEQKFTRQYIENKRITNYPIFRKLLIDGPIIDSSLDRLTNDATAEPPIIIADTKKDKMIIESMFKRIGYQEIRGQLLHRAYSMGDGFNTLGIEKSFQIRKLGYIVDIFPLDEATCYRNTDGRDRFIDRLRAFSQVNNGMAYDPTNTNNLTYFSPLNLIHVRNSPYKNRIIRYGRSQLYSLAKFFNTYMLMLEDLAADRHFNSRRTVKWGLGTPEEPIGEEEQIETFRKALANKTLNVQGISHIITAGNVTRDVVSSSSHTDNVEDINLYSKIIGIATMMPAELIGLIRTGADNLETIKNLYERTLTFVHKLEESQLLIPLIRNELILNGRTNLNVRIIFPKSLMENRNQLSKRLNSEIQAHIIDPGFAFDELYGEREMSYEKDILPKIEEINRRIGESGMYQPPPENLNKGEKGNETDDSSVIDIHDVYKTGGK